MTRIGGKEAMKILEERYQYYFGDNEELFCVLDSEQLNPEDCDICDCDIDKATATSMKLHSKPI